MLRWWLLGSSHALDALVPFRFRVRFRFSVSVSVSVRVRVSVHVRVKVMARFQNNGIGDGVAFWMVSIQLVAESMVST
jgi:hypothetical protein